MALFDTLLRARHKIRDKQKAKWQINMNRLSVFFFWGRIAAASATTKMASTAAVAQHTDVCSWIRWIRFESAFARTNNHSPHSLPKCQPTSFFATPHNIDEKKKKKRTNEAKGRHFKRFISSSAATINRSTFIHRNHCVFVHVCVWEGEMVRWRRLPMYIQDLLFSGAVFSGLNAIPMLNFTFCNSAFSELSMWHTLPFRYVCIVKVFVRMCA